MLSAAGKQEQSDMLEWQQREMTLTQEYVDERLCTCSMTVTLLMCMEG